MNLHSQSLSRIDHVVAEDEEIDILEKQVDQDGVSLLLRFHPVASDMREVVSAMKIRINLERVADESVTIARRAKHLNNRPAVRELALLEPPYRLAVAIFRDSMRAFADGDCELARTLKLKASAGAAVFHAMSPPRVRGPNCCVQYGGHASNMA